MKKNHIYTFNNCTLLKTEEIKNDFKEILLTKFYGKNKCDYNLILNVLTLYTEHLS